MGLDIGGSKLACVEGTQDAHILQRAELPTQGASPFRQSIPAICGLVESQLKEARRAGRSVVALSVSVGGPLRIKEGVLVDPPHLPGWHGAHLKRELSECFPGLPVYIEHDGNAGALAEFHFGAGKLRPNLQHLVFLTFGTGLGAGIVVHGQIVHGATDTAGEVGHWRLSPDGPEAYGKCGSWEALASGAGLRQLALQRFPHKWNRTTQVSELIEAMVSNDPDALTIAAEAGEWMGRGIALLIDVLNPELIVLGSLAVVLGDRVLGAARRIIAKEALSVAATACEIVPAVLGRRIGDVASLMAALTDPAFLSRLQTMNPP